jgi:Helicase conserved C-terminal domain/SEC-C motif
VASPTSLVPKGWRLQDIPSDELAALLQISPREVVVRRATLARQHKDPAWVAAALEALPAATLALLHVLIDAGGLAMERELAHTAREAYGMSVADCQVAALPAISRMLVVPLRIHGGEAAFAVVLPAGALIAPLVANLDLHELVHAGFVASEAPVCNPRTFLAVCVASRHFDVRVTLEGRPHRGASKRLAKQVGLDDASLEAMLLTGLDLGMLSREGELVRPDLDALADAAVGRYPRSGLLAELHAQLASGPVASAALARAFARRFDRGASYLVGSEVLAYVPGFAIGTVGDVAAVARGSVEGIASGHVTPSFGVILPPESPLLDIVRVGACCEWVRLDRAIVARITKSSIARAVTGGASAGQLLEQLAAASRHPIPQNVEAAIRDWAGSVTTATIATGHVIVVDPGVHARVASALAALDARALAPGVLVVGDDTELRAIALVLGRAGIYHREVGPTRPPPPGAPRPAPPLPAPGAARLRARVAAWRRGEPFEGTSDDFLDRHRFARPASRTAAITGGHGGRFDDDPLAPTGQGSPARHWLRTDLRERLQHAARHSQAFAVQLASDTRYLEITQVMRRGTTWMVLGEDLMNDGAVALRLDDIQAIAELPDDFEIGFGGDDDHDDEDDDGDEDDDRDDRLPERTPWRPGHGEVTPPGHVLCPCGSGMRYRHCCRDLATA